MISLAPGSWLLASGGKLRPDPRGLEPQSGSQKQPHLYTDGILLAAVSAADLYAQALQALERGQGLRRRRFWSRLLSAAGLPRDEQIQIRCALAEAWLLQDDVRQAH